MSIFKKKNKQKKEDVPKNEIMIRVYKTYGGGVRELVYKYLAREQADMHNTLISVNEDYRHEEDMDFSKDSVLRSLAITMGLDNVKTKAEKIDVLEKAIAKTKKRLELLEKYVELNAVVNYPDEYQKLNNYEILKNHIVNIGSGKGTFFKKEDGYRVYEYDIADSFLIPCWQGIDDHTQYPDYTRKKRITVQEDFQFKQEMDWFKTNQIIKSNLVLIIAINVGLLLLVLFAGYKVWLKSESLDSKLDEPLFACANYVDQIAESCTMLLNDSVIKPLVDLRIQELNESKKQIVPQIQGEKVLNYTKK